MSCIYMDSLLSIVIIGRNESQRIADCVSAARAAAGEVGGAEIIYVDSASTDASVEIAKSLGARAVAMPPELRLCPSAGRYVGSRQARGEFVLFLDADTLIYKGFLPDAIRYFILHQDVAGINGRIDDLNETGVKLSDIEERYDDVADVKWLRGPACFYRRKSLLDVGSFNPDLAMEEEAELGLRLRSAGWKLRLMPVPMACHTRCYHCQTISSAIHTFKRDVRTCRLGEITRTIAAAFRNGTGLEFCWLRLKTTIILTVWIAAVLGSLLAPPPLSSLYLPLVILACGFFSIYLKKRSAAQTLVFIINKLLVIADVLAGVPKVVTFRMSVFSSETVDIDARR